MSLSIALALHAFLFLLLWGAFGVVLWWLRQRLAIQGRYWRAAFKAAPLLLASLPFAGFVVSLLWLNLAPPSVQFQNVFGQQPDATVSRLLALSDPTSDGRDVFLRFKAPEPTLGRILSQGFTPFLENQSRHDLLLMPGDLSPPEWWTAPGCKERLTYVANAIRGWDRVVLIRCQDDGHIFVQARWID